MNYISNLDTSPYLQHFGILGMHWGVRRYQNADGSLTAAGKKRYNTYDEAEKKANKFAEYAKRDAKAYRASGDNRLAKIADKQYQNYTNIAKLFGDAKVNSLSDNAGIKAAKQYIKGAVHQEAEFGDYYYGGKRYNYFDQKLTADYVDTKQNEKNVQEIKRKSNL